ncbi:AT-hook motif nuclear-localized protein 1 [Zea mays]|uniref:AT-hook motif nuclear-localized protein n=1 Tax=Zea mays TaxID=4577 RepID=A0A1D6GZ91_MAIZE|nr:AT-hook motif nuclear-localized protein 1 [Zea mays]
MKVISFSQQGPRAICILSANGVIANVTLRQQDSLGGTVTYEGRFELLSLSGSFTPTDSGGGTRSRSGGMSVSLAAADGRARRVHHLKRGHGRRVQRQPASKVGGGERGLDHHGTVQGGELDGARARARSGEEGAGAGGQSPRPRRLKPTSST